MSKDIILFFVAEIILIYMLLGVLAILLFFQKRRYSVARTEDDRTQIIHRIEKHYGFKGLDIQEMHSYMQAHLDWLEKGNQRIRKFLFWPALILFIAGAIILVPNRSDTIGLIALFGVLNIFAVTLLTQLLCFRYKTGVVQLKEFLKNVR